MKKATSTIIVLIISCSSIFAQHHHEEHKKPNKEKIQSMKIAFITDKLNLTPEEAQQFWPIYNEYENKKQAFFKDKRIAKKKYKNNTELTDDEIAKHIEDRFTIRQKQLDLDKEYHSKFQTVLSIRKINQLYMAQEEFKRGLLKKLKHHNNSHKKKQGEVSPK